MREYTEKEYWEGLVPDELFEEYLNKYGYEYTPVNTNENTKLATSLQKEKKRNLNLKHYEVLEKGVDS